ncbi:hypothetical protein GCM10029964_114610 [Kibdelosporangium lantanae]
MRPEVLLLETTGGVVRLHLLHTDRQLGDLQRDRLHLVVVHAEIVVACHGLLPYTSINCQGLDVVHRQTVPFASAQQCTHVRGAAKGQCPVC